MAVRDIDEKTLQYISKHLPGNTAYSVLVTKSSYPLSTSTTTVPLSYLEIPAGYNPKVGDVIISSAGHIFTTTALSNDVFSVTYVSSIQFNYTYSSGILTIL